jgi:hypothetical protein
MRSIHRTTLFSFLIILVLFGCKSKVTENNFAAFDSEFFANYLPEFPGARLLTREDIPNDQQVFFDEAKAQLQILQDMNSDAVIDYVICGISDSLKKSGHSPAYFVAIFKKTEAFFQKEYVQPLRVSPVNLTPSENRPGVLISFAFSSDFVAEIYFENKTYQLQRWY